MILKSIELNNIRSYVNEKIVFPKGTVLLSGDIGSGKSSILLSIEFALFGIIKGSISGSELLRHGSKEGSVILNIKINSKEVFIKRSLKRSSLGVGQAPGYIIVDGQKTDLVPLELKARILQMMGYSLNLIKKSKSLTFRYTIYTPQEEMKRIIMSKPEERLDILRSVFSVDKYKRIRENLNLYVRELKKKLSYYKGRVEDLDKLTDELKDKKEQRDKLEKLIKKQKPVLEKTKNKLAVMNKEFKKTEKNISESVKLKNEIKIIENKSKSLNENINNSSKQIKAFKIEIENIKNEIKDFRLVNEQKLNDRIKLLKGKKVKIKEEIDNISKNIALFEYQAKESKTIEKKVMSLTKCQTCLQDVSDKHKEMIREKNKNNIDSINLKLPDLNKEVDDLNLKKNAIEKKLSEYDKISKEAGIIKIKQNHINEKEDYIKSLEEHNKKDRKNIILYDKKREDIILNISSLKDSEKEYNLLKEEIFIIQNKEREFELEIARFSEQKKSFDDIIENLIIKIKEKIKLKDKIIQISNIRNWLENFFENLMIVMEKHVMGAIYYEFNDLVKKWFTELIGDETINVRLDSDFTPLFEQNGYETEIHNLSGGEKTAIALSYRLALNKIINEMIGSINTKDIIILDEPTDGFSSEQLDRVREVIEDLDLKQIIIVSHEPKIECFVENIIRIEKHDHESKVIC